MVGQWIKQARNPAWAPNLDEMDLDELESTFNSWWCSIQPDWHIGKGEDLRREGEQDWGLLNCSGINGVLSAVAALFFWSYCAAEAPSATATWALSVSDALYALEELAKSA